MGLLVPEEYGGAGASTLDYALAMEEISWADAVALGGHLGQQLAGVRADPALWHRASRSSAFCRRWLGASTSARTA